MAARGIATLIGIIGVFTLPFGGWILILIAIGLHIALKS